jgi:hypothetical protein
MPVNDEQKPRRTAALWLSLSCLIPALYVLSVGPVCWSYHRIDLGTDFDQRVETALEVFYLPLIWLQSRSEWFREWLDWYADLL